MAKTKISEFSATPANNTDIDGINIAEGCAPSGINDAIRELMSQLKDWQAGTSNDPMVIGSSGSLTLSYGTANCLAYLNGSKVLTTGSALVFDGTNLGIGTSSPQTRLQVNSSGNTELNILATGGTPGLSLTATGASIQPTISYLGGTGTALRIGTTTGAGGSFTMQAMLDNSGNLGLGVTPSAWQSGWKALQIGAGGGISDSGGGNFDITNNYYRNSGDFYLANGYATLYRQASGQHRFFTAPNNVSGAGAPISFTQAMTLDASGQLGIGPTSPGSQLHLAKALSSTQTNAIQIQNTGIFTWGIGIDNAVSNSSLVIQSGGAGGTTRVAIDSSGNLLVGTTGVPSSSVKGWAVRPYTNGCFVTSAVNSTGSLTHYEFLNTNGQVGQISTSGSTTTYATSSDYRLKENVQPMTGALAKVAQLKPCTYKWKADGSDGEGFIAHELAEVVPQCVTGEKDAVDADGNPVYQGIDTSFLVATLTAAIQELKAEFDAYKAAHP